MSARRITELDGLRGVAAFVVVVNQNFLASIFFAVPYEQKSHALNWVQWSATYTPLHLLWKGTAAVAVFFVLSRFVLRLPFTRKDSASWWGYYPRRPQGCCTGPRNGLAQ